MTRLTLTLSTITMLVASSLASDITETLLSYREKALEMLEGTLTPGDYPKFIIDMDQSASVRYNELYGYYET